MEKGLKSNRILSSTVAVAASSGSVNLRASQTGFHGSKLAHADLDSEQQAKPMPAEPDGLVANVDATLMEQIFDAPKRKREAHVKHHHLADDLWAGFEIEEWGAIFLPRDATKPQFSPQVILL